MNNTFSFFIKNIFYFILALCLISSSIAIIPMGLVFYSLGILMGIIYILKNKYSLNNVAFIVILSICYLSSILSGMWDYRIFVFTALFIFITPIFNSKRIFIFRLKYILFSLYIFPIIALVSLYCYFTGVNMMSLNEGDVSWDFSALFGHSMWLGAANGLSNIVLLWQIYKSKNKVWQIVLIIWLFSSIFLSVVSGSRSAFLSSLIAMSFLSYLKTTNLKRKIQSIIVIGVFVFVTYPFYYKYAGRMLAKMEYQKEKGETSRASSFKMRTLDFQESPIIGVGFAVGRHVESRKKKIGRMESGSGWLSILSQTGILGFIAILAVVLGACYRVRKYLKKDYYLQLLVPVFIFLAIHSLFEGYILTPGYYLCVLFWGILGLLYVYPINRIRKILHVYKK
jgi:hypothetical protein